MLRVLKLGGVWQIWNVTCDRSIVVENCHRNMGFFRTLLCEEAKGLLNVLKSFRPAFSLSDDFTKVVLDSNLEKSPKGFHVFDYFQFQEAGIDINKYASRVLKKPQNSQERPGIRS